MTASNLHEPCYYSDYRPAFRHFLDIQESVEYDFFYDHERTKIIAFSEQKSGDMPAVPDFVVDVERIELIQEYPSHAAGQYYDGEISFDELAEKVGEEEAKGYRELKKKLNDPPRELPDDSEIEGDVYTDGFEPGEGG